eukprot:1130503-Rhodomonas_salina.1
MGYQSGTEKAYGIPVGSYCGGGKAKPEPCQSEVKTPAICLRARYGMSGTSTAYCHSCTRQLCHVRLCYPPTHLLCDVRYRHGVCWLSAYAMSGTNLTLLTYALATQ